MDYQIFDLMRTRYGLCGSWTVWNESPWSPDSIRAPLLKLDSVVRTFGEVRSQQQLDTELPSLRTDLVLVALNFAERAAGITAVTDRLSLSLIHI